MRERMKALEPATRASVSKGGISPATRSQQMEADIEADVAQARLDLDARDARVAKLEARTIEKKKHPEKRSSLVRVAESNYSVLFDETQTLKQ